MAQVIVRRLDERVVEAHRRHARARGVSLEQELRDVLTRAAPPALAEASGSVVVTADRRLIEKAAGSPWSGLVKGL